MTVLLSCLAFALAFVSVWLASEALKRSERAGRGLVKPYIGNIHETLDRQEKTLKALQGKIAGLEREVGALKDAGVPTGDLDRRLAATAAGLDDAARFMPSHAYNA